MSRAANRRAGILGACLSALASGAAADSFLQITVNGDMSPALRAAIADVIDPSKESSSLINTFSRSFEVRAQSDKGPRGPDTNPLSGTNGTFATITSTKDLSDLGYSMSVPYDPAFDEPLVIVDPKTSIASAVGKRDLTDSPGGDIADLVAAPIDAHMLDALTKDRPCFLCGAVPLELAVNASVVNTLSQFDQDVAEFGATTRTVPISPDASAADVAALVAVASAEPTVQVVEDAPPSVVMQDLPAGAVIQTGGSGQCNDLPPNWPFDTAKVTQIIRLNQAVMEAAGVLHPNRARILVVDSGLPNVLAEKPDFKRFLLSDPALALAQGYYWEQTGQLGSAPTCEGPSDQGDSWRGFVSSPQAGECVRHDQNGGLTPAPFTGLPASYIPDHGGLVGVIAAGGPKLLQTVPGLDDLVGIGFAKVMQLDKLGNNVFSNASDIRRAFEYALRQEFPIINTSLRVESGAREEIRQSFSNYAAVGLTVAAAGNDGGELRSNSASYPASMAKSSGNNDQLIVVAGVERDPSGSGVRLMEQSNFSATLVDLAAPGWSIPSLSGSGDLGCFTGTSAAAPQVSFAAALLVAFGYDSPVEIRRRLLATARIDPALQGKVRGQRLFDLPVALDVFADLVWMRGESGPRRGQLMPQEDGLGDDEVLMQLCDPAADSTLFSSGGNVDANRLILWQAGTNGAPATIWHEDGLSMTEIGTTCMPPDGAGIRFRGAASVETEALPLTDVARIVPSRLRMGLKIAMTPDFAPEP